ARHQGGAPEPSLPGRAGLVLQPGGEERHHRGLVHGRGAGGGRALILGARPVLARFAGCAPPMPPDPAPVAAKPRPASLARAAPLAYGRTRGKTFSLSG